MSTPLPVTVLGGYLGAGKTTVINHLLRHADGVRLAVLVNEFGDLAIDADLIEARDEDMISIAGGCVCCSFGSDLSAALMDIAALDPAPDHIVIEASGVAIPGAIVASLGLISGVRADGVVVLADAETIKDQIQAKYIGDTVARQLRDADIIVLNKIDLVADAGVDAGVEAGVEAGAVADWLADVAPAARVIPATHGRVPAAVVMESFLGRPGPAGPHFEAAHLRSEAFCPDKPIDTSALAQQIAQEMPDIIRAKGFARDIDGRMKLLQIVGRRFEISDARPDARAGIVCIGFETAFPLSIARS